MKYSYLTVSLIVSSVAFLSFQKTQTTSELSKFNKSFHSILNSSGSPGGRTGAPGESTCTACHSGTVQSGTGFNTVIVSDGGNPVTTYTPGMSYTVVVNMATNNTKNGFEIVALGSSDQAAGTVTITDATNTKKITVGGKQRATHTSAGNALTTWTYTWVAPATDVGAVTFYLATNQTNLNGQDSGDIIRTSQHVIGSTASIAEHNNQFEASVGFSSNTNSLMVDITSLVTGDVTINLIDLNGKSVQFEQLGSAETGSNNYQVKLNNELPNGIYVAHVAVNNTIVTKKIYISK